MTPAPLAPEQSERMRLAQEMDCRESRYRQMGAENIIAQQAGDFEAIIAAQLRADETEIANIRAELARCKADAGRVDWLAKQFRTCTVRMNGQHPYTPYGPGLRNLRGPTFRDAIDAAMAEGEG